MQVIIDFTWEERGAVGLFPSNRLSFPPVPAEPGIYRFQVSSATGTEVYIGESQDLRHRMQRNYGSTHTGRTNVRIRTLLQTHPVEGRRVRLSIIRRAQLVIDGERAGADLTLKPVRLIVENAALATALRAGWEILKLLRLPLQDPRHQYVLRWIEWLTAFVRYVRRNPSLIDKYRTRARSRLRPVQPTRSLCSARSSPHTATADRTSQRPLRHPDGSRVLAWKILNYSTCMNHEYSHSLFCYVPYGTSGFRMIEPIAHLREYTCRHEGE